MYRDRLRPERRRAGTTSPRRAEKTTVRSDSEKQWGFPGANQQAPALTLAARRAAHQATTKPTPGARAQGRTRAINVQGRDAYGVMLKLFGRWMLCGR